ncbi:MAG: hypothetical protein JXA96_12110 [Sedimentisphaerales bacterium]|nr:hypothetical protein [Sedimentisphaerales bacterium]
MDVRKRHLRFKRIIVLMLILAALIILTVILKPGNPIVVIKIVDDQDKPISGATVTPYALRPKPDGGQGGHYLWAKDRYDVPSEPVVTDKTGKANVPYPTFVLERVETGEITVKINHPEYISGRQDIVVSTKPPHGAPWIVWKDFLINRLKRRTIVTRANPIVLKRGEILILKPEKTSESITNLYAQTSSDGWNDNDFWDRSQAGIIMSRKHAPGVHEVRLIGMNQNNELMFSDMVDVTINEGVTNSVSLALKPSRTVRGRLSDNVPRPVVNGRVVINIIPLVPKHSYETPQWHTWTNIDKEGSFKMPSLPEGNMEIVALCDGFISTDGNKQNPSSVIIHPQKHTIGANDLDIVIDMELTARLEVTVLDDKNQLLEGVRVFTWPNVSWGDWSSTIFCSDLYKTIDRLKQINENQSSIKLDNPTDFFGISDNNGLAVLSNVPVGITSFSVEHDKYVLPKVEIPGSAARREANIILKPGTVTRETVILEPQSKDPQSHY